MGAAKPSCPGTPWRLALRLGGGIRGLVVFSQRLASRSVRGEQAVQQASSAVQVDSTRVTRRAIAFAALLLTSCAPALAAPAGTSPEPLYLLGIPVDFILFALTLLGVALFHRHTLQVALAGLAAIVAYKLAFTGFKFGPGLGGLARHMGHEWVILANLFLLLMGFALLSRHFEKSRLPDVMPAFLPDDWKGAFLLLVIVCVLSSFLDNIAAALIGGVMAREVFRGKVHIGYLAAIVAASNAGGAGSVVGDTTTTMMWIAGVSPLSVVEAYVAVAVAIFIFGIPAAFQQQRYSPIRSDMPPGTKVDWSRVGIVFAILIAAILANVIANLRYPDLLDALPVIGAAVWVVLLITAPWKRPDWEVMPETFKGTIFLLALVTCASLMPVEKLPAASWQTAMGLGFVSAVFDNIPLTALALKQGGYDWGFLAYAVGFGGSMIWFGSSAGVALANMYPEAKSVGQWLWHGWHVTVAYIIGFFFMLAMIGWHPDAPL
jgi:Na+/H+ antiporter NhaD/arsenite permease-like protein